MLGEDILNPVQKRDITVGTQESGADIPVFREDGKNILDERKAVFVERTYRMGMDQIFDVSGQFVFNLSIMS